jgi:hypothetical protein
MTPTNVVSIYKGDLLITVDRGYVFDQFIQNRYTLQITTQIGDGDDRRSAWEFDRSTGECRHMGWTSAAQNAEVLANGLRSVAERMK